MVVASQYIYYIFTRHNHNLLSQEDVGCLTMGQEYKKWWEVVIVIVVSPLWRNNLAIGCLLRSQLVTVVLENFRLV